MVVNAQETVKLCSHWNFFLTVRGGGRSVAGSALYEGAVLLSLSNLRLRYGDEVSTKSL